MSSDLSTEPPVIDPPRTMAATAPRPWVGNCDTIATVWLVGSLLCLSLAAVMRVGEHRQVYLPGISTPLPEMCGMVSRFGIDCPGCGLTRTFIYMAHGRFLDALHTNPVGILVFLFACAQIPMGLAQVVFRIRNPLVEAWGNWNDWCTAGLLVALVVQWPFRLLW